LSWLAPAIYIQIKEEGERWYYFVRETPSGVREGLAKEHLGVAIFFLKYSDLFQQF
jgi:hypothetical protein